MLHTYITAVGIVVFEKNFFNIFLTDKLPPPRLAGPLFIMGA